MKYVVFLLFYIVSSAAWASIVDYGPPADVLGHWEFDLYDTSGAERATATNPLYISSSGGAVSTAANQASELTILQTLDNPLGGVAPGTAGTNSFLSGTQFNTTAPAVTTGQQVAAQSNRFGELITIGRNKSTVLTGNATTVIKTGAGRLHGVVIGNNSANGTITFYDNTAASGAVLLPIATGTPSGGLLSTSGMPGPIFIGPIDVEFNTGLTAVTAGSTSNSFTIIWY